MNTRFTGKVLLVAFLAAMLGNPLLSSASIDKAEKYIQSTTISISDLDLSKDAGVVSLYKRLKSNIDKVCGHKETHVPGSLVATSSVKRHHRQCSIETLDRVVKTLNNKKLTDLHRQSNL